MQLSVLATSLVYQRFRLFWQLILTIHLCRPLKPRMGYFLATGACSCLYLPHHLSISGSGYSDNWSWRFTFVDHSNPGWAIFFATGACSCLYLPHHLSISGSGYSDNWSWRFTFVDHSNPGWAICFFNRSMQLSVLATSFVYQRFRLFWQLILTIHLGRPSKPRMRHFFCNRSMQLSVLATSLVCQRLRLFLQLILAILVRKKASICLNSRHMLAHACLVPGSIKCNFEIIHDLREPLEWTSGSALPFFSSSVQLGIVLFLSLL